MVSPEEKPRQAGGERDAGPAACRCYSKLRLKPARM
jgi:hypothetical protein